MKRKYCGGFLGAFLLLGGLLMSQSVARADITGSLYIGSSYSTITHGGSFDVSKWEGQDLAFLYCIDTHDYITPGGTYNRTRASTDGEVDNSLDPLVFKPYAGSIAFLLDRHGVGGQTTDAAVALQLAIWKLIYGAEYLYPSKFVGSDAQRKLAMDWYSESAGKTGNVGNYLWFSPGVKDSTTIYQAQVGRVPEPTSVILFGAFLAAGLLGIGAKRNLTAHRPE